MRRPVGALPLSGANVYLQMAAICDLDDGRVTRVRNYLDRSQALEASGLPE